MNKQKQNIAIAKLMGVKFTKSNVCDYCNGRTPYAAGDDYGITIWEECKRCQNTGKVKTYYIGLPDYTKSRDAICNALSLVNEENVFTYFLSQIIWDSLDEKHLITPLDMMKATPKQVAKALLETLGLWEDEE